MRKRYILMDLSEFQQIKPGDTVICKIGRRYSLETVVTGAFYNCNADDPDWEIETENAFFCWDSVYVEVKQC